MTITTGAAVGVAAQAECLRRLADVLEAAGITGLGLFVSVRPDILLGEAERVAVVDALAARLDMTAGPLVSGGIWSHEAGGDLNGVGLRVSTFIAQPARRCTCGALCTHGGPS